MIECEKRPSALPTPAVMRAVADKLAAVMQAAADAGQWGVVVQLAPTLDAAVRAASGAAVSGSGEQDDSEAG